MAIKNELNNRFTNVIDNKLSYSKGKLTREDYKRSMTKGGKLQIQEGEDSFDIEMNNQMDYDEEKDTMYSSMAREQLPDQLDRQIIKDVQSQLEKKMDKKVLMKSEKEALAWIKKFK